MEGPGFRFSFVGAIVLVVGVWWLLGEMGVAPFEWRYIGPLALILLGLSLLLRPRRGHGWQHWHVQAPPRGPPPQ